MLVNDAYKVISAIVATKVGREAFIASRGMRVLSLLNIRQVSCDWWTAGHVTSVLTADWSRGSWTRRRWSCCWSCSPPSARAAGATTRAAR